MKIARFHNCSSGVLKAYEIPGNRTYDIQPGEWIDVGYYDSKYDGLYIAMVKRGFWFSIEEYEPKENNTEELYTNDSKVIEEIKSTEKENDTLSKDEEKSLENSNVESNDYTKEDNNDQPEVTEEVKPKRRGRRKKQETESGD